MKLHALTILATFALMTPSLADYRDSLPKAHADLIDIDGQKVGLATLTEAPGGVLIHVRVEGLTPGKKGLHLHSHGSCDRATGFKSAKGHVGKVEGGHGLLNPAGPEAGDIPNIFVGADGIGEMEAFSTRVSLTAGEHTLLDHNSSTFIIHENADDHITQPIGGAGGRIACGLIVGS
jgi:Cu-Zn family superoxide dismutase